MLQSRSSRSRTSAVIIAALVMASGCFARGQVRYSDYPELTNVRLATGRNEPSPENLGMVEATASGWGSCNTIAAEALTDLLAQARALGATRVEHAKFRARWHWTGHALCQRYFPFFPGVYSVEVQGLAVAGR